MQTSVLHKVAAFAAIYVIWGSTYLAIRVGIETLPPFLMTGLRFVVAGVLLYAWARARGAPRPTTSNWRSATHIGALLMFGGPGLVTWAEQTVPSGLAAVFVATVPLWMTVLERLFFGGPRLGARVIAGIALGLLGVAILVQPWKLDRAAVDPVGAGVVILAALFWAIGSLRSRGADLPRSPTMATAVQMLMGGVVLTVAGTVTGEWARFDITAVSMRSWIAIGYLVFFGSIVGLTAYVWLLRVTSPTVVSTYAFVNPVVAVGLGWALAGEAITGRTLMATALVVVAVVIIQLARWSATPRRADEAAIAAREPASSALASARRSIGGSLTTSDNDSGRPLPTPDPGGRTVCDGAHARSLGDWDLRASGARSSDPTHSR